MKPKNYYRRITEALPQRVYFINFIMFFLFGAVAILSLLAGVLYMELRDAKEARKEALDSFAYWKQVTEKHPNSPDAFYEIGYYAARLGDRKAAYQYLREAIRLDPEFDKAKTLSKLIVNSE